MYEVSTRGVIMNNLCYDNENRGIYISNSRDCEVLFNTCYRNGASGIVVIGVDREGGAFGVGPTTNLAACNNLVWGNILMDNCHPDLCPKEPDGRGEPWHTRAALIMPDDRPGNVNNVSDYNLIWNSDGRPITFWKGWHEVQYPDLAAWQQATGNDVHTRIAAPLFVDLAKRDFRPAPGSPALHFVRPRMTARFDMLGAYREYEKGALNTAGALEH